MAKAGSAVNFDLGSRRASPGVSALPRYQRGDFQGEAPTCEKRRNASYPNAPRVSQSQESRG